MFLALVISLLAAILPTILYGVLFYWADRYEREPVWLVLVAFFWGAAPAILFSIIGEVVFGAPFSDVPHTLQGDLVEGAVIAPIVEELCKGVALLAIYFLMRREFDGVLDGLVYGALIGFGFAMTENFFYFIGAYDEGGFANLTVVIFLRAVLFGLNHAFYTAFTGIGLGLARIAKQPLARWFWALAGLSLAMLTHSMHNAGASLAVVDPSGLGLSIVVAMASIGIIFLAMLLAWQHERNYIRIELADEIGTLLTPDEYEQLTRRWRNPVRLRQGAARQRAARLHLCVKLALYKHRLRQAGSAGDRMAEEAMIQVREQLATLIGNASAVATR